MIQPDVRLIAAAADPKSLKDKAIGVAESIVTMHFVDRSKPCRGVSSMTNAAHHLFSTSSMALPEEIVRICQPLFVASGSPCQSFVPPNRAAIAPSSFNGCLEVILDSREHLFHRGRFWSMTFAQWILPSASHFIRFRRGRATNAVVARCDINHFAISGQYIGPSEPLDGTGFHGFRRDQIAVCCKRARCIWPAGRAPRQTSCEQSQ